MTLALLFAALMQDLPDAAVCSFGTNNFTNPGGHIAALSLSPDGSCLAAVSDSGPCVVFDIVTGKPARQVGDRLRSVSYSPDGKTLAASTDDNRIVLFSASSGEKLREMVHQSKDGYLCGELAFSPDSKFLGAMPLSEGAETKTASECR